jgi:uncharacterized protein with beta-barrel porin domain
VDAGSLAGTFSSANLLLANNFARNPELSYVGNKVLLTLDPGLLSPLLPSGASLNQRNIASGIDNALLGGVNLSNALGAVFNLTGSNLTSALTQLSGETATDTQRGAFKLTNQFLNLMIDPFVDGRFGGGASGFAAERGALPDDIAPAYAEVLKEPPPKKVDDSWTVWGAAFGGTSRANGDPFSGSNNVSANTYGFASGADYRLDRDNLVGFALAAGGTNWGLAQGLGSGRSDAFQAGIYGRTALAPTYLAVALSYTNNWFTTDRFALGDQITAKFNGESYGGRLEGGYRYLVLSSAGRLEFAPYAALQTQSFHTPTYSETDLKDSGFGLTYGATNATDTRSELGARFSVVTALNEMPLILHARVAWAHDWVSNPALNATFQSVLGSSFVVNGAPIPTDSALAAFGAELHMNTHWSLAGRIESEFARNSETYAGIGTLRYSW